MLYQRTSKVQDLIKSILASLILLSMMQPVRASLALEELLNEPYFDA